MDVKRWSAPSHERPRGVTILGSTGSVGQNTVDLIARNPEGYRVEALVAGTSVELLAEQARRLRARLAVVANPDRYRALREALAGTSIEAAAGPEAVIEAASRPAEWVMAAVVGFAGLASTLAAARRGAIVALANKEALVCAGRLLIDAVEGSGGVLLPVELGAQRDLSGLRSCAAPGDRPPDPHGLWRPVPELVARRHGRGHAGAGAGAP